MQLNWCLLWDLGHCSSWIWYWTNESFLPSSTLACAFPAVRFLVSRNNLCSVVYLFLFLFFWVIWTTEHVNQSKGHHPCNPFQPQHLNSIKDIQNSRTGLNSATAACNLAQHLNKNQWIQLFEYNALFIEQVRHLSCEYILSKIKHLEEDFSQLYCYFQILRGRWEIDIEMWSNVLRLDLDDQILLSLSHIKLRQGDEQRCVECGCSLCALWIFKGGLIHGHQLHIFTHFYLFNF